MSNELKNAIIKYYSFQDDKVFATQNGLKGIKRFIELNAKDLLPELISQVSSNGSLNFMLKLEKENIIIKDKSFCTCNGGTWRKV